MADLANLVLAIDSSQVKTGTAALDGLTAAGARAEAATTGLSGGFKGASAEAAAMASAAQLSARSAMDQAAGFGTATNAARLNTMAMRESLVVAREISRGNFTRIPGSLTLLAQGIGSGGGLGAYAQALGLIKQVQNAELAEAAAATAASAAGVEAAARKAGASILAADTEVALAQAQLRTAETAGAEAAAQTRLAAASQAVAAASAEAAIAENALALAQGRATEASAAAKTAATTTLGTTGAVLIGVTIAALGTVGAFKALQATVDDSGALDRYAKSITKTKDQLKDLEEKVGGFQVTWGDVFHGIGKAASDAIGSASIWDAFKEGNKNAFTSALHNAVDFAAKSYGVVRGSYQTIVDDWSKFPSIIGDAFYSAVNVAIGALNKLVKFGTDQLNALIGSANKLPFVHLGTLSAPQIGAVGNPYTGAKLDSPGANVSKYTEEGRARINAGLGTLYNDIVGAAEDRIKGGLPKERKGRHPREKKENDHGLAEALAKLDVEIKGQYALAAAYGVSGAAAQRAEANQKAAEDAIQHKGGLDQFRALELQKIVASDVAKQAKANEGLQIETSIRARLNGQITDGTLSVGQYNEQLKLQTMLNGLNNDLENADAAHKQVVNDVIRQTIQLQTQRLDLETELKLIEGAQANNKETARIQFENSLWKEGNDARAKALAQYDAMQKLQEIDPQNHMTKGARNDYVQSAINKATANDNDPFHQWAKGIPKDAADINTALQSIETKGLDSLASSIAGVVTGTESLGKAFKSIASSIISDIVQMTIKMLIFRAISSIFGGASGGLGQSKYPIVGGVDPLAALPHAATGGSMIIGGNGGVDNNVMSINGQPKAMVGQGETLAVFPAGKAPNDNQSGPIELKISFGSAPDFAPYVEQVAGAAAGQAVKISVDHTNQTIKALRRPGISGGR
jgi:hypothetical protein